ncbi:MAG TPA: hypothetical protein VF989_18990 [Polyangiaceae bacterium]|jgi:hypothetical protein
MKILAHLLALCVVMVASRSGTVPAAQRDNRTVRVAAAAPAAPEPAAKPFVAPKRIQSRSGKVFLVPQNCLAGRERYDLLIHFHGVPDPIERGVNQAKLDAVVAIVNHGVSSSSYRNPYDYPKAFSHLVGAIDRFVNQECPNGGRKRAGRIALSAWSAGYQAVYRMLRRENDAGRVDAVLLADGLHAALSSKRPRALGELTLQPFVDLAARATKGRALFALTHSAIPTPTYASTTETADYLLHSLSLDRREPSGAKGTRTGRGGRLELDSQAIRGGFSVRGFHGMRAADHAHHLKDIGYTLLPLLSERWKPRP